MHFETLKIFCDVVRHQSFSRGASANAISQSAASQAIHQLEKRLGVLLIDRSKRPWLLTPQGEVFFDGCQEIVARFQDLEEAVCGRQTTGYTVRVAAIYSVGLHNMKQYVDRFHATGHGADVEIEYMHPDQVYESVLKGQADLGLISFASHAKVLTAVRWRDEEMVIACLPSHRFAKVESVEPSELSAERFISFERGLPIRRAVDRFLREHKIHVEHVAEFDNIDTIKQAVVDGAGIALLPSPTMRGEIDREVLVGVPFAGRPFVRPLSVIHRRKRRQNAAVTAFSKLLVEGQAAARPSRKTRSGTNGKQAASPGASAICEASTVLPAAAAAAARSGGNGSGRTSEDEAGSARGRRGAKRKSRRVD